MAATVAELTPAELREMIHEVVREELAEMVGDPDAGLKVRPEFLSKLEDRRRRFLEDGRVVSVDEAFAAVEVATTKS